MSEQLDKKTYEGIVWFTLQFMVELGQIIRNIICLQIHCIIMRNHQTGNILNKDGFLELCKEAGIK